MDLQIVYTGFSSEQWWQLVIHCQWCWKSELWHS